MPVDKKIFESVYHPNTHKSRVELAKDNFFDYHSKYEIDDEILYLKCTEPGISHNQARDKVLISMCDLDSSFYAQEIRRVFLEEYSPFSEIFEEDENLSFESKRLDFKELKPLFKNKKTEDYQPTKFLKRAISYIKEASLREWRNQNTYDSFLNNPYILDAVKQEYFNYQGVGADPESFSDFLIMFDANSEAIISGEWYEGDSEEKFQYLKPTRHKFNDEIVQNTIRGLGLKKYNDELDKALKSLVKKNIIPKKEFSKYMVTSFFAFQKIVLDAKFLDIDGANAKLVFYSDPHFINSDTDAWIELEYGNGIEDSDYDLREAKGKMVIAKRDSAEAIGIMEFTCIVFSPGWNRKDPRDIYQYFTFEGDIDDWLEAGLHNALTNNGEFCVEDLIRSAEKYADYEDDPISIFKKSLIRIDALYANDNEVNIQMCTLLEKMIKHDSWKGCLLFSKNTCYTNSDNYSLFPMLSGIFAFAIKKENEPNGFVSACQINELSIVAY